MGKGRQRFSSILRPQFNPNDEFNLIHDHTGLFGWCSLGRGRGGGCFPPTPSNPFVFDVRRLQFCTGLLWGRTNILQPEKSESN